MLQSLHPRLSVLPVWFHYVVTMAILVPVAGVALTSARAPWLRVERTNVYLFFATTQVATPVALARLIGEMVYNSKEVNGLALPASSIAVWAQNVLSFSLLDWQLHRGGPHARENNLSRKPDWLFPQAGVPEDVRPAWQPRYVDCLFLGYSTATAFSPTDAGPPTSRAKLLMMLQSLISLVTIPLVASRAITILQ